MAGERGKIGCGTFPRMQTAADPRPAPRRVLVTGGAGAIGRRATVELIRRGHFVRSFDRGPSEQAQESVVADIADHQAVRDAAEGMDAIVHLAATPDDAPFLEKLLQPNVVGLFNVMDAARAGTAKRVVLASSMQVISGLRHEERVKTADDAAPTNHYALTKVWAEAMGEMYARCYGLGVISARIGWMTRNKREAERLEQRHAHDTYLSPRDAGRFFAAAVEADAHGFHILYAVSRPRDRAQVDLEGARRAIGYEPLDVFPEGLDFPWP